MTLYDLRWRDAWFCWKLARDPLVREVSLDQEVPTIRRHLRWMRERMRGPYYRVFVIRDAGRRCGVVRLEFLQKSAVVGIALTLAARGRGLALDTLLKVTPWASKHVGHVRPTVVAEIKPTNTASINLFTKAGYKMAPELFEEGVVRMIWQAS